MSRPLQEREASAEGCSGAWLFAQTRTAGVTWALWGVVSGLETRGWGQVSEVKDPRTPTRSKEAHTDTHF